jgi:hypothetical protein
MAFSNFDFGALAMKYDRIMNASRSSATPQDATACSRQSEIFTSIVQAISQIVAAYEMPFRFDCSSKRDPSAPGDRHCAMTLIPGETPWNENKGAIDVGSAGGDQFFGFLMNISERHGRTMIADMRALPSCADLTT